MTEWIKRTTCYVASPSEMGLSGHWCGHTNPQWSEFVGHLWCAACGLDFVPDCIGILDMPIPVETARLMGISLDSFDIATGALIPFDMEKPCAM